MWATNQYDTGADELKPSPGVVRHPLILGRYIVNRHRHRHLALLVTATIAATLTVSAPAASAPANLTPHIRAAAAQLAADLTLPLAEAQRRIARQDQQTQLADRLRDQLGDSFAGAWIDHTHKGRLTVAVVGGNRAGKVRAAAANAKLGDTVTVSAARSHAALGKISDAVAERIAAANTDVTHGLQAAIDVKANTVRIDVPQGKQLTDRQQKVVDWARETFGPAVSFGSYQQKSVPMYCGGQYYCDPPLRSGLATYMAGGRCTTAFMTYYGSAYYMLTAGHCAEMGYYFYVPTYYYGTQYVGYAVDYDFGYWGDSALIYIEDPGWWQPRGWVFPQQVIRSYSYDYVGQYVCKQGSTTGYTCGQITETDATVYYPNRTLTGMTWSTACVAAGDSGSGVFYGSYAHGILSGGPYSGCGMIHEPITRALNRWGVYLLAG